MRLTSLQYVFKRAQARRNVAKTVGPARGDGGATAIASGSEEVVGEVGMRAVPDYEECIGGKKHLVLGAFSYTGPPIGANG